MHRGVVDTGPREAQNTAAGQGQATAGLREDEKERRRVSAGEGETVLSVGSGRYEFEGRMARG